MPTIDHFSFQLTDRETSDIQEIQRELVKYNQKFVKQDERRELVISVRDGDRLIAGLCGNTNWGWLYTRLLWVSESVRGQGVGERLMKSAEEEALHRGCSYAWVDTFSPEAKKFYLKIGYEVFGELPDCPPEGTRFFLKKNLKS